MEARFPSRFFDFPEWDSHAFGKMISAADIHDINSIAPSQCHLDISCSDSDLFFPRDYPSNRVKQLEPFTVSYTPVL